MPDKISTRWPVMVGSIVGGVVVLFALVCGIRCCYRRRRRRRINRNRSHQSLLQSSAHAHLPTAKPPAYESPKLAAYDFRPMPKTKDDALPPLPSDEAPPPKKAADEGQNRGMELENMKALPPQRQSVSSFEALQPKAGVAPLKTSVIKNPFEAPVDHRSQNSFDASSRGENRDYNPTSPLSPQRIYSPLSPSNYTRYTTSPFIDPPSRQSSPFSSAASMRTISYVPPYPPYAAYSSSTAVPQTPSLLDEPKSPYRAFSPLLQSRHESSAPTPPPAAVDPPSEVAPRVISPLNSEPLELGTSYNMRPQSMVLDEHRHPEPHTQATGESPNDEKDSARHDAPQQASNNFTPGVTPQEHRTDR